jgi:hypothetical protein
MPGVQDSSLFRTSNHSGSAQGSPPSGQQLPIASEACSTVRNAQEHTGTHDGERPQEGAELRFVTDPPDATTQRNTPLCNYKSREPSHSGDQDRIAIIGIGKNEVVSCKTESQHQYGCGARNTCDFSSIMRRLFEAAGSLSHRQKKEIEMGSLTQPCFWLSSRRHSKREMPLISASCFTNGIVAPVTTNKESDKLNTSALRYFGRDDRIRDAILKKWLHQKATGHIYRPMSSTSSSFRHG